MAEAQRPDGLIPSRHAGQVRGDAFASLPWNPGIARPVIA